MRARGGNCGHDQAPDAPREGNFLNYQSTSTERYWNSKDMNDTTENVFQNGALGYSATGKKMTTKMEVPENEVRKMTA
jgi:hypothetical protein